MYLWGLTIDLVSSVALDLAAGLCVDFAAHIGYAFLSCRGTKTERSIRSVEYIGGAVLHGGVTTLLALCMLGTSSSYIFTAYFKVSKLDRKSIHGQEMIEIFFLNFFSEDF